MVSRPERLCFPKVPMSKPSGPNVMVLGGEAFTRSGGCSAHDGISALIRRRDPSELTLVAV